MLDHDDLSALENNSYLFASHTGEPFDGRACLGAFHKIRPLASEGQGVTHGKVYLAFNKMTKEEVAMKFIKLDKLLNVDTVVKDCE